MQASRAVILIAAVLTAWGGAWGQDSNAAAEAAAAAAKQDNEERYSRLRGTVDDLLAAQAVLQKRLTAVADELRALREENRRAANNYASQDDLRKLGETVRELDRKREEDRKLILEEIRKLAVVPLPEPPPKKSAPAEGSPSVPIKGYEYEVKEKDTIGGIVAAYQQKGVKVTSAEVLRANPGLKPKSLRIGQKIIIPDPSLKP